MDQADEDIFRQYDMYRTAIGAPEEMMGHAVDEKVDGNTSDESYGSDDDYDEEPSDTDEDEAVDRVMETFAREFGHDPNLKVEMVEAITQVPGLRHQGEVFYEEGNYVWQVVGAFDDPSDEEMDESSGDESEDGVAVEYETDESDDESMDEASDDGTEGDDTEAAETQPVGPYQPMGAAYSDANPSIVPPKGYHVQTTQQEEKYVKSLRSKWVNDGGDPAQVNRVIIPAGYRVLGSRRENGVAAGRMDWIIWGYPSGRKYTSWVKFYPHMKYLLGRADGTVLPETCECDLC
jgi:hypothetical protein